MALKKQIKNLRIIMYNKCINKNKNILI